MTNPYTLDLFALKKRKDEYELFHGWVIKNNERVEIVKEFKGLKLLMDYFEYFFAENLNFIE